MSDDIATGARQVRQQDRQRLISEAVATDGVVGSISSPSASVSR